MNAKELIIEQKRAELGEVLCELVDNIKCGSVPIGFVHWFGITHYWDYDTTERICYCVDNGEIAGRIIDCIFLQAETYTIRPPALYKRRCEALKKLLQFSLSQEGTPASTKYEFLEDERVEEALKTLENVDGYAGKMVIDRTQTPWKASCNPDWGKVRQLLCEKYGIEIPWKDWGELIGVKGETLRSAYNHSGQTSSQSKIVTALNKLK